MAKKIDREKQLKQLFVERLADFLVRDAAQMSIMLKTNNSGELLDR